jgi:hypothetical protein
MATAGAATASSAVAEADTLDVTEGITAVQDTQADMDARDTPDIQAQDQEYVLVAVLVQAEVLALAEVLVPVEVLAQVAEAIPAVAHVQVEADTVVAEVVPVVAADNTASSQSTNAAESVRKAAEHSCSAAFSFHAKQQANEFSTQN